MENNKVLLSVSSDIDSTPNNSSHNKTATTPPSGKKKKSALTEAALNSLHSDDQNLTRKSGGSIASGESDVSNKPIEAPVLVYHENARSIVFRDHIRRATEKKELQQQQQEQFSKNGAIPQKRHTTTAYSTEIFDAQKETINAPSTTIIAGFQPTIQPLPKLELVAQDQFQALLDSPTGEEIDMIYNSMLQQQQNKDQGNAVPIEQQQFTAAELEVVHMLQTQRALVKTIVNVEWTEFLHRFRFPSTKNRLPVEHADIPPREGYPFNSFVTSTSLLPRGGKKMRCFGSPTLYTTGVVFALPTDEELQGEDIDTSAAKTKTWSWPAGYAAKTEFNIDSRGELINGREEAMENITTLRQFNDDYLYKKDYMVGMRLVKGGLKEVPYNEIFARVGGCDRIVGNTSNNDVHRSLETGLGLPVALFVRTATFGHLISLLRTRARLVHVIGETHFNDIPLLLITPELGVRVLTETLQKELIKIAARNLNPFQNPVIAHKTNFNDTHELEFEQKLEELIDLDDTIRKTLTPEECARLAGGFGATDESVALILKEAMLADKEEQKQNSADSDNSTNNCPKIASSKLQDIVNEGLAAAVRSGDYYTSRQLLILYTIVASMREETSDENDEDGETKTSSEQGVPASSKKSSLGGDVLELQSLTKQNCSVSNMRNNIPKPPPPPPLDTDRLRSATNSDGLLAVLGAAQVLKAMQDGSAKRRTMESVLAVEEWVEHGEQSMAFRVASWFDQRAAQNDLKIAMQNETSFLAFVSNKAISNRRNFAKQLRSTLDNTDFTDVRFLEAIHQMLQKMHSPCLRLELLQYVLGLDNRYSIAHVRRSVELAATCLGISNTGTVVSK